LLIQARDHGAPASRDAGPVGAAQASELAERLREALGRVTPRHAEVFCMHFMLAMTNDEIAVALNMTVNAVGVLLHRGRAELRQLLEEGSP